MLYWYNVVSQRHSGRRITMAKISFNFNYTMTILDFYLLSSFPAF